MYVYIVTKQDGEYGPNTIAGVYSTVEKAKKQIPADPLKAYYYTIKHCPLDADLGES